MTMLTHEGNHSSTETEPLTPSAPMEEEYGVPPVVEKEELQSASPNDVSSNKKEMRQMAGAAAVAGAAGLVLMGPVVGLAAAAGGAVLATTKGKGGDIARATGDAAADVGARLKKMDKKHHISEKATKSIVKSANWVSKQVKPKK